MDKLVARLFDLTYEFFGVIIPGLIASIFGALWWAALGPLSCWIGLPAMTWSFIAEANDKLIKHNSSALIIGLILVWYLLGQVLLEFSRKGKPKGLLSGKAREISLAFFSVRVPNPEKSYTGDKKHGGAGKLFEEELERRPGIGKLPLNWNPFFQVARTYLAQNHSETLVTTYQDKYTLHRSIGTAAAILFWMSALALLAGWWSACSCGMAPNWLLLISLMVVSLIIRKSFFSSFEYHWYNFGNAIITETYALTRTEQHSATGEHHTPTDKNNDTTEDK